MKPRAWIGPTCVAAILACAAAASGSVGTYRLSGKPGARSLSFDPPRESLPLGMAFAAPPPVFRFAEPPAGAQPSDVGDPPPGGLLAKPEPNRTKMALVTAGVIVGSAAASMAGGLGRGGFNEFQFGDEGWFKESSYAGGADKASHFVFYNGLARELRIAYTRMGYTDKADRMAFGVALAAGLVTEVGDGLTGYGFSWEDLVMDAFGAGAAVLISRHGLDDLVGFRFGKVAAPTPPECCRYLDGNGKDYSSEMYTGDLKLAGLARRIHVEPGPARFLMLSVAYGSKGYRHSFPEFRQRVVGVELGIDFPEILYAVGVRDTVWWGRGLYMLFNFIRVPFTSIGVYYDLNGGGWSGPNNGQIYDPGP